MDFRQKRLPVGRKGGKKGKMYFMELRSHPVLWGRLEQASGGGIVE